MKDDDFDDFETIEDDSINDDVSILKESKERINYSEKRRRLEELLEEKRLRAELDEYYDYYDKNDSYDNEDMQYD